jgi:uncharacterized protein
MGTKGPVNGLQSCQGFSKLIPNISQSRIYEHQGKRSLQKKQYLSGEIIKRNQEINMDAELKPTAGKNRVISIDVLRGFALLGIVMVNVLGFNSSFFDFGGFYNGLPEEPQRTFYTIYISLTSDKFIFIFSFLFGYGIYMQQNKFKNKGQNFAAFLRRRMFVLFLFGVGHIVLLWAGDILLSYAIAGMILLALSKSSTKIQILFALFLYFFIGLWLVVGVWIPLPNALSSTCTECLDQAKNIYAHGSYFSCLKLRLFEYYSFRNINVFYYLPKIAGTAILGFIASKNQLHQKVAENKPAWGLIWASITIVGVVSYFYFEKIVDFESPYANAVYMSAYEFMNLFVASSYLLLVMVLASFVSLAKILNPIALMGRMSLSNYLLQSLLLSVIFYGWGFGMFGQTKVTHVVLIGIGVYLFQVVLVLIWFRYYNQGPLEKLWRKLSY